MLWQQETQTGVILSQYETLDFDPSQANPILANYTQSYYDWYHFIYLMQIQHLVIFNKCFNEWHPVPYINSLWLNIGDPSSYTLDLDETQNRFTGSASLISEIMLLVLVLNMKKMKRVYQVRTQNLWILLGN